MPFSHSISSFGGISFLIKICKIHSHYIFYFMLFLLAFTSAGIIFHKFLKTSFSIIWKKRFLSQILLFWKIHSNPPTPAKIRWAWQKYFVNAPLKVVSTTFVLVYFLSLNESTSQTRRNVFLFLFKSSFLSQKNQILEFYIFKFHDIIRCLSIKQEIHFTE